MLFLYVQNMPHKKHIIIYSHGFGVRKDDRGLLTNIATSLPEAESILFDYFKIDEQTKEMFILPFSHQVKKLNEVIAAARSANPEAIIDLIGHSQGTATVALAQPDNIRRAILLAPVFDLGLERTLKRYSSRADADINLNGISKLPPLDGLIRVVPKEYWQERVTIDAISAYNTVAKKINITFIKAKQDELLPDIDLSQLDHKIKLISLDGDHNFNNAAREPLLSVIRDLLI